VLYVLSKLALSESPLVLKFALYIHILVVANLVTYHSITTIFYVSLVTYTRHQKFSDC